MLRYFVALQRLVFASGYQLREARYSMPFVASKAGYSVSFGLLVDAVSA